MPAPAVYCPSTCEAPTRPPPRLHCPAEHSRSPHVSRPVKTVVHPGEVNRIRELPQHPHVLVTHTDAPQLYVWNMEAQPDRAGIKVGCPGQDGGGVWGRHSGLG